MFFIPFPLVLIEILIFSTFVHFYNFWDVFLCYLLPSFLGVMLFSMMGRNMMMFLQGGLAPGEMPGDKMLHRGAILLGSILLIIPLFLTRVLALFLILPILRHLSIFIFKTFLFKRLAKSQFSFIRFGRGAGNFGGRSQGPFPFEKEV
ncbi:MAG: FxsA family protein, partial [Pseudobdellovibrionaceae bacterium]